MALIELLSARSPAPARKRVAPFTRGVMAQMSCDRCVSPKSGQNARNPGPATLWMSFRERSLFTVPERSRYLMDPTATDAAVSVTAVAPTSVRSGDARVRNVVAATSLSVFPGGNTVCIRPSRRRSACPREEEEEEEEDTVLAAAFASRVFMRGDE